jgi:hypothetical protein
MSRGVLGNIGLEISGLEALFITSKVNASPPNFPMGATFTTIVHDYAGGVRFRIPFGAHELTPSVTGGEHAYVFRSGGGGDRSLLDLPDTIYRYARFGLEGRLALPAGFSVLVAGGYRLVLNGGGQIHDTFFPRSTVAGADVHGYIAWRALPFMDVRLGAEYTRYWYDMHAQAGDKLIAGGALDQYLSGTLGAAFVWGDSQAHASQPSDDEIGKERARPPEREPEN